MVCRIDSNLDIYVGHGRRKHFGASGFVFDLRRQQWSAVTLVQVSMTHNKVFASTNKLTICYLTCYTHKSPYETQYVCGNRGKSASCAGDSWIRVGRCVALAAEWLFRQREVALTLVGVWTEEICVFMPWPFELLLLGPVELDRVCWWVLTRTQGNSSTRHIHAQTADDAHEVLERNFSNTCLACTVSHARDLTDCSLDLNFEDRDPSLFCC